MAFLAPLFFIGLTAIAVPVLIHLIQRERKDVIEFPSLMFLRKIPYQSVERRRIHNWLLLALRAAAMFLLVAAFTRPFFTSVRVCWPETLTFRVCPGATLPAGLRQTMVAVPLAATATVTSSLPRPATDPVAVSVVPLSENVGPSTKWGLANKVRPAQ